MSVNPSNSSIEAHPLVNGLLLLQKAVDQGAKGQNTSVSKFDVLWNLEGILSRAEKQVFDNTKAQYLQLLCACANQGAGVTLSRVIASIIYKIIDLSGFEGGKTLVGIVKSFHVFLSSKAQPQGKISTTEVLGTLYLKKGIMLVSCLPDTINTLVKQLKSSSSHSFTDIHIRVESLRTLMYCIEGAGHSSGSFHSEVWKACKLGLSDKAAEVRAVGVKCLSVLGKFNNVPMELEDKILIPLNKHVDDDDHVVRREAAFGIGLVLGNTFDSKATTAPSTPQKGVPLTMLGPKKVQVWTLDAILTCLANMMLKATKKHERANIARSYIKFLHTLSYTDLESNLETIVASILKLLPNTQTIELPQMRICISYIIRTGLGEKLGESGQISMVKILLKYISTSNNSPNLTSSGSFSSDFSENVQIVVMGELTHLIVELGEGSRTVVENLGSLLIELLTKSSQVIRLGAAACLRSLAIALPKQLTPLLIQCLSLLSTNYGDFESNQNIPPNLKSSKAVIIRGYAYAAASLGASVKESYMGVPNSVLFQMWQTASMLLHTPTQGEMTANPQGVITRMEAGWSLIDSLIHASGSLFMQPLVPIMLQYMKGSFAMTGTAPTNERDVLLFTTIRSKAISVIISLATHTPDILTQKILNPIIQLLTATLQLVLGLPTTNTGFKPTTTECMKLLELSLLNCFYTLPTNIYSQVHSNLLRMVVLQLLDGPPTHLLRKILHSDDSALGPWESGDEGVEEKLIETRDISLQDASLLWNSLNTEIDSFTRTRPTSILVVNAAVKLFGTLFAHVERARAQLLTHIVTTLKECTTSQKTAMQINVVTAMLLTTKALSAKRIQLGKGDVLSGIQKLIHPYIADPDPALRRAAGETLGMLCRSEGDTVTNTLVRSIAELVKKPPKDVLPTTRAGAAFTLACIQRYVGGMMSQAHLPSTVSTLHVLAQDQSSILTSTWALHALTITIQCSGLNFSSFATPTLMLIYSLLLSETFLSGAPPTAYSHLGRVVNAIVGALGPELEPSSPTMHKCNAVCAEMEAHSHPLVRLEAIAFKQRLILFAPRVVSVPEITPFLVSQLSAPFLSLRSSAVTCLRQLIQAKPQACEGMVKLAEEMFGMLDHENDRQIQKELQNLLTTLLDMSAGQKPSMWLQLCKGIVTSSKIQDDEPTQPSVPQSPVQEDMDNDGEEEEERVTVEQSSSSQRKAKVDISHRWYTKVFSMECMRRVITVCKTVSSDHFDLAKVRQVQNKDALVLHLHELVTMAFNSATSITDSLRPVGVWTMSDIVEAFSATSDPDYEGHGLLELYQAQITSALRPAFEVEAQPQLTAVACDVLVTYVDNKNMSHSRNVLKKILALLTAPLATLRQMSYACYSEKMSTMVQLAILKALARLHTASLENIHGNSENVKNISPMLIPSLPLLRANWMAALKDYALVTLEQPIPSDYYITTFHTRATALEVPNYYTSSFPLILKAVASLVGTESWLEGRKKNEEYQNYDAETLEILNETKDNDDFYLIMGLALKALTNQSVPDRVALCIQVCSMLLNNPQYLSPSLFPYSECKELVMVFSKLSQHDELSVRSATSALFQRLIANLPIGYFDQIKNENEENNEEKGKEKEREEDNDSELKSGMFLLHQILSVVISPLGFYLRIGPHQIVTSLQNINPTNDIINTLKGAIATIGTLGNTLASQQFSFYSPLMLYICVRVCEISNGPYSPLFQPALNALNSWGKRKNEKDHELVLHSTIKTVLKTLTVNPLSSVDPITLPSAHQMIIVLMNLVICLNNEINAEELHNQIIDFLINSVHNGDSKLRATILQTIRTFLQTALTQPTSPLFTMGIKYLDTFSTEIISIILSLQDPTHLSEDDILWCSESIKILVLAHSIIPENNKKQTLYLIVNTLVVFLSSSTTNLLGSLHTTAIQVLLHLATTFVIGFKEVIVTLSPQHKSLLETSLRQVLLSQQSNSPVHTTSQSTRTTISPLSAPPKAPQTLKLDISKYS